VIDEASRIKALVIVGHTRANSFCHALATAYWESISSVPGVQARFVDLATVPFELNMHCESPRVQPLEPELTLIKDEFLSADHVVIVFPTWWGTMPAILKGFLDRILAPGEAFVEVGENYRGLLKNKTAHLLTTMDAPAWVYRFIYKSPGVSALERAVLKFCGFEAVRTTRFDRIKHVSAQCRSTYVQIAAKQARQIPAWRRRVLARAAAQRWIRAIRLQFYPMTLLAYGVGALLATSQNGRTNVLSLVFGYTALFLLEVAAVFANEAGDTTTDLANKNFGPFTGGSRVLAHGELTISQVWAGVRYTVALGMLASAAAVGCSDKPLAMASLCLAGLILGIGYTLAPLRLVYRTMGEFNVALTHSFLMVFAGAISQPGAVPVKAAALVSAPLFLAVFSAITLAGIPDHDADQIAAKRTIAVAFGIRRSASIAMVASVLSACTVSVLMWMGAYPVASPALLVGVWLHCFLCVRAIERRAYGCARIDSVLAMALSFILWFCVPQLIALLSRNGS
jgi:1,4-dihydroxy-2-naphthoate polyprenyltransferase